MRIQGICTVHVAHGGMWRTGGSAARQQGASCALTRIAPVASTRLVLRIPLHLWYLHLCHRFVCGTIPLVFPMWHRYIRLAPVALRDLHMQGASCTCKARHARARRVMHVQGAPWDPPRALMVVVRVDVWGAVGAAACGCGRGDSGAAGGGGRLR